MYLCFVCVYMQLGCTYCLGSCRVVVLFLFLWKDCCRHVTNPLVYNVNTLFNNNNDLDFNICTNIFYVIDIATLLNRYCYGHHRYVYIYIFSMYRNTVQKTRIIFRMGQYMFVFFVTVKFNIFVLHVIAILYTQFLFSSMEDNKYVLSLVTKWVQFGPFETKNLNSFYTTYHSGKFTFQQLVFYEFYYCIAFYVFIIIIIYWVLDSSYAAQFGTLTTFFGLHQGSTIIVVGPEFFWIDTSGSRHRIK